MIVGETDHLRESLAPCERCEAHRTHFHVIVIRRQATVSMVTNTSRHQTNLPEIVFKVVNILFGCVTAINERSIIQMFHCFKMQWNE